MVERSMPRLLAKSVPNELFTILIIMLVKSDSSNPNQNRTAEYYICFDITFREPRSIYKILMYYFKKKNVLNTLT